MTNATIVNKRVAVMTGILGNVVDAKKLNKDEIGSEPITPMVPKSVKNNKKDTAALAAPNSPMMMMY